MCQLIVTYAILKSGLFKALDTISLYAKIWIRIHRTVYGGVYMHRRGFVYRSNYKVIENCLLLSRRVKVRTDIVQCDASSYIPLTHFGGEPWVIRTAFRDCSQNRSRSETIVCYADRHAMQFPRSLMSL